MKRILHRSGLNLVQLISGSVVNPDHVDRHLFLKYNSNKDKNLYLPISLLPVARGRQNLIFK